jgi:hypothetical protein
MSNQHPQREWTWIDRAAKGWPAGEWDGEPDKVQWKDEATGLDCLAVRHGSYGHWCGYVGVPESHPAFGTGYDDVRVKDDDWPRVHGGLTFAEHCQPAESEDRGVCHVPYPGDPDHVWWLGFDCAHSGDYSPDDMARGNKWRSRYDSSYKTLRYVQAQCRSLASQLAEAA